MLVLVLVLTLKLKLILTVNDTATDTDTDTDNGTDINVDTNLITKPHRLAASPHLKTQILPRREPARTSSPRMRTLVKLSPGARI